MKYELVIFDGTTQLGEAMAVVLWFDNSEVNSNNVSIIFSYLPKV